MLHRSSSPSRQSDATCLVHGKPPFKERLLVRDLDGEPTRAKMFASATRYRLLRSPHRANISSGSLRRETNSQSLANPR